MGQQRCNQRVFLFTVCSLQLISTVERQVFDLLGYQWLPIAANFLHVVSVIVGFFGGYQYRRSYLIAYGTWQVVWLAWNALLVCLYLDVGLLDKDGDWLNLGTGAASWWEVNGAGCRPLFGVNATFVDPLADLLRPPRPDLVEGCLLDYTLVEVVHAGLQILLAMLGLLSFALVLRRCSECREDLYGRKPRSRATSLYSVQYSSTVRGGRNSSPLDDEDDAIDDDDVELSEAVAGALDANRTTPMTPRRVKRRSVSRGSGRSHSKSRSGNSRSAAANGLVNEAFTGTLTSTTGAASSSSATATLGRSHRHQHQHQMESASQRAKKRYANSVNRFMNESSTSNDSFQPLPAYFPSSHPNGHAPNGHAPQPPAGRPPAHLPSAGPPTYHSHRGDGGGLGGGASASAAAAEGGPSTAAAPGPPGAGHSNPLYVSSRPSSVYSISAQVDLDYRPPSAHSSYSNWHGQRPTMRPPLPQPAGASSSAGHAPPAPQPRGGGGHAPPAPNLHGHSPTPSDATVAAAAAATTNTFGTASAYHRSGPGHYSSNYH